MNNLPSPIEPSHPIFLALAEIQKPRSTYQLKNFVVGQHDTEPQQYRQVLLEIQQLIYTIQTVSLELKKGEIEINRLKKTGDEIDEVEAQIKELGQEQTRLAMIGAKRELQDLIDIWDSFEHKYTYEEIEQDQSNYWQQRLTRQAQLEAMGQGGVSWASLDALRQIGELKPSIETIENNVKEITQ